MKIIVDNNLIDLSLVYNMTSERKNLSRGGCPMFRDFLDIHFLNEQNISIQKPDKLDLESWEVYKSNIMEFWAENKIENIKTFNL